MADSLFEKLSAGFDEVYLFDSGSTPDNIPKHVTHAFDNIYWAGACNKAMELFGDYDIIWFLGDDIGLEAPAAKYREAMESAMPFGCWSPCINGRSHPFMQASNYTHGNPMSVRNIEGQAIAFSGALARAIGKKLEVPTQGFGQDFWLCYKARQLGMCNIIDGRITMFHPPEITYDENKFHNQMDVEFSKVYGADFRQTIFEYSSSYAGNRAPAMQVSEQVRKMPLNTSMRPPSAAETLWKKAKEKGMSKTIFTVDNGWGIADFIAIANNYPDCKKVLLKKGVSPLSGLTDVEVIPYDGNLSRFDDGNSIGLFARIGPANFEDFKKLVAMGVPIVANIAFHRDVIQHMKTGLFYQDQSWAIQWIRQLIDSDEFWKTFKANSTMGTAAKAPETPAPAPAAPTPPPAAAPEQVPSPEPPVGKPSVSIITPTFRREPKIVRRCINCMQLQTVADWELLICSDGADEQPIRELVVNMGDARVTYSHTTGKKPGDFGNTVRSEMLKKARGEFVLFCDDDNIILPDYLWRMTDTLRKNPDAAFAICRIVHFGPLNEAEVGKAPKVLTGIPPKLYHIDTLQVLVRREAMQSVGWDTEHGYVADGHSLQKLAETHKWVEVQEVLGFHL
jgi:GT2 family glycosyltransferase